MIRHTTGKGQNFCYPVKPFPFADVTNSDITRVNLAISYCQCLSAIFLEELTEVCVTN